MVDYKHFNKLLCDVIWEIITCSRGIIIIVLLKFVYEQKGIKYGWCLYVGGWNNT